MNHHERDRLDEAIDLAARQLVSGTLPPSVIPAVLSSFERRQTTTRSPRATAWRVAFGVATVAAAVAVFSFVSTRVPRDPGDPRTSGLASGPAEPANDTSRPPRESVPTSEEVDRVGAPGPVRIARVTVAPVRIPVVTIARVEVGLVEVAPLSIEVGRERGRTR